MALTELQLPAKTDFYRQIQSLATEMERNLLRWEQAAEFLANVTTADMDAMGVPAGQIRTDLSQFRTALEEVVNVYRGQAVTPTNDPSAVMDKIRQMLVV